MKNQVLVKKYAQGLVQAVKDEAEFRGVLAELRVFLDAYAGHAGLRNALLSPFVDAPRKARILDAVLKESRAGEKTARLLGLLLERGRLELAADVAAVLPETWNERHGVLTFEVASVIPLTDTQKARLRATLEAAEKRLVSLVFRIDPSIVGGLAVKRGHIVYDVSVEGNLNRMKEQILQG
jgi:F-type H+-transporting ATPase subunit delta